MDLKRQSEMQARAVLNAASIFCGPLAAIRKWLKYRELIFQLTSREISQRYQETYLGCNLVLYYSVAHAFDLHIRFFHHLSGQMGRSHPLGAGHGSVRSNPLCRSDPVRGVFRKCQSSAHSNPGRTQLCEKDCISPGDTADGGRRGNFGNSLISIGILIVLAYVLTGTGSYTFFLLPVVYIPLIFLCLGVSWFLASLGVYARDIRNGVEILVQMLMFLSPVFYPAGMVPEQFRAVLGINPLTSILDNFRRVLLWNEYPDWTLWGIWTAVTLLLALLGYLWFMRTKDGFPDIM